MFTICFSRSYISIIYFSTMSIERRILIWIKRYNRSSKYLPWNWCRQEKRSSTHSTNKHVLFFYRSYIITHFLSHCTYTFIWWANIKKRRLATGIHQLNVTTILQSIPIRLHKMEKGKKRTRSDFVSFALNHSDRY